MTKTIKIFALIAVLATTFGCATADDLSLDTTVGSSQADSSVRGGFDLWKADNGEWYFHLEAGNYEILLASEGYQTRTGALNGILSILDKVLLVGADAEDDGVGMGNTNGAKKNGAGNGLNNMRSRAKEISGKIDIDTRPGKGTSIRFRGKIPGNGYFV